jgi:hypothetical protein
VRRAVTGKVIGTRCAPVTTCKDHGPNTRLCEEFRTKGADARDAKICRRGRFDDVNSISFTCVGQITAFEDVPKQMLCGSLQSATKGGATNNAKVLQHLLLALHLTARHQKLLMELDIGINTMLELSFNIEK